MHDACTVIGRSHGVLGRALGQGFVNQAYGALIVMTGGHEYK